MRRAFARSSILSFVLSAMLVACADGPDGAEPSTAPLVAGSVEAETAARLHRGGTFMFELERSPRVAALMKAKCALRAASCYDDIKRDASTEGVRISTNAEGQLIYTSFGAGETYLETPFRVVSRHGTQLQVEATGPGAKAASGLITMDLPADGSLAIVDPIKGRLSYTKQN
jgi:hypothetical protein